MSFFFHLEAHHLEAKTSTQLLTCEPTINILAKQTFDFEPTINKSPPWQKY
jgi:hypothetical protein